MAAQVPVIEDDAAVRQGIVAALRNAGFRSLDAEVADAACFALPLAR